jgi:hypothetical protein
MMFCYALLSDKLGIARLRYASKRSVSIATDPGPFHDYWSSYRVQRAAARYGAGMNRAYVLTRREILLLSRSRASLQNEIRNNLQNLRPINLRYGRTLKFGINGHSVSLDSVSVQFQALSMLLLSDHRPFVSKTAQPLAALQTDTICNSSDEGFRQRFQCFEELPR